MGVELMERLEATQTYDRTTEDVGNIIELAHVNIWVKEPHLGHLFYVCGLGLTRDPFGVTGISSMWVNVGRSQFHLLGARRRACRRRPRWWFRTSRF